MIGPRTLRAALQYDDLPSEYLIVTRRKGGGMSVRGDWEYVFHDTIAVHEIVMAAIMDRSQNGFRRAHPKAWPDDPTSKRRFS